MGQNVFQRDVLAEETHCGRLWSVILLPAPIGLAVSTALLPSSPARWGLQLVCVVSLGALAMALSGFQYRFLRHGVEIRTLGFHLRSIPKQAIVSYSIEPWTFLRGYGIRGIGSTRAYVWGNKVVHIQTTDGEIFLGHDDPERIVRDLDLVTGFAANGNHRTDSEGRAAGLGVGRTVRKSIRSDSTGSLRSEPVNRDWYKTLVWIAWLALPITALDYWQAWDQLPMRMAVHFDANWRPNGYTSREGAMLLGLGMMSLLLIVFTVASLVSRAAKAGSAWPLLVISYVSLGFVWYANHAIVEFNRKAQPAHSGLAGCFSPTAGNSDELRTLNVHSYKPHSYKLHS